MKLKFNGDLKDLAKGIEILGAKYGYEAADDGIHIDVVKQPGNIRVELTNGKGLITYNRKVEFFRALGLFLETQAGKAVLKLSKEPQFEMSGAMIDVSRNAVLTVGSVKKTIEMLAVMGLNVLMLYTEDTYTVEKYPISVICADGIRTRNLKRSAIMPIYSASRSFRASRPLPTWRRS